MDLYLYNTLTRKKEKFEPIVEGEVKMYSCGPTVYSYQHIGNMRAVVFADVLRRTFLFLGFKLKSVMNITDVGHLVSDEDFGEDKMLKAAEKENKSPYEIAEFYTDIFMEDIGRLNVLLPDFIPKATEHIQEQIDMIRALEKKGFTYLLSDGVYFDVSKFKNYGRLSQQDLSEKKFGVSVEVNTQKRHPCDFALWKFLVGENKNHIMKWDSPWGVGFPGWHIECSAMSHKYLGSSFDIHTGGVDHIAVHHENEIAQNVCSGFVRKVNFWIHNAHLTINGEKISKSLGNGLTVSDLGKKGFSSVSLRVLFLLTHYRKQMNFTFESLEASEEIVRKVNDFVVKVESVKASLSGDVLGGVCRTYLEKFGEALCDDLNTSSALACVFDFMREVNSFDDFSQGDRFLVLEFMEKVNFVLQILRRKEQIPQNVVELAVRRKKARDLKNWQESDYLREEILKNGYIVRDDTTTKEGFILVKNE